jgi:hypothetical protein
MLRVVDKAAMIPDTLFVINEHLAANFTYFDLGDGDDPPVYLWEDGDQVYGSSWTTASWPRVARCAFPTGSDVFGRPRRSRHKATPCPSTRT